MFEYKLEFDTFQASYMNLKRKHNVPYFQLPEPVHVEQGEHARSRVPLRLHQEHFQLNIADFIHSISRIFV